MNNKKKIIGFIFKIVFLFVPAIAFAFSISIEDSGKGSFPIVYAVSPESGQKYHLWDEDVSSSSWILDVDNVLIVPSESGWIRRFSETDGRYVLSFSSRMYSFVSEMNISEDGNHLLMSVSFTNKSSEKVQFAPFLLLDTSIAEVTGLPFKLPDGSYVSSEQIFEGSRIPEWICNSVNSTTPSLYLFLNKGLSDRPLSVTLANWLRLKQSGESYSLVEGRSFDNLPFSEDDSAVMLRYSKKSLGPGETRTVQMLLGLNSHQAVMENFNKQSSGSVSLLTESTRLREYTLMQRLDVLESVIDEINGLLDNGENPSAEVLAGIENKTEKQEMLQAEYENL